MLQGGQRRNGRQPTAGAVAAAMPTSESTPVGVTGLVPNVSATDAVPVSLPLANSVRTGAWNIPGYGHLADVQVRQNDPGKVQLVFCTAKVEIGVELHVSAIRLALSLVKMDDVVFRHKLAVGVVRLHIEQWHLHCRVLWGKRQTPARNGPFARL